MRRPDFSIIICHDSFLLQKHIELLFSRLGEGKIWQRHVFWGDEAIPPAFWEHLTLQSLFATSKALIVRNAQNIPAESLRLISEGIIKNSSKNVWPIICLEVPFDKGRPKLAPHIVKIPFFTIAQAQKSIEEVEGLHSGNLPKFIQETAKSANLNLTSHELQLLSGLLPLDAIQIHNEISKLALCKDEQGKLTVKVEDVINHSHELGIFELLSSIQQKKDAPAVWRHILDDQLQGDNTVFSFNSILLREARQLWQIFTGESVYLPPSILQIKRNTAKKLGFAGIAKIWEYTRQADKSIKTGEANTGQAFETLTANIFSLFSR